MNDHRIRGSHHDTTHIDHAIYARDGRLEEEFYEIDFPLTNPETHNIGT